MSRNLKSSSCSDCSESADNGDVVVIIFPSVPCVATGDFDGGGPGISDIAPFVQALFDPTPGTTCTADLFGDGTLDGPDIQPSVSVLVGA